MKPTAPCTFTRFDRKDHRGVDLISDVPPFGRQWYAGSEPASNAIGYAMHYSRSNDAVVLRVCQRAGDMNG